MASLGENLLAALGLAAVGMSILARLARPLVRRSQRRARNLTEAWAALDRYAAVAAPEALDRAFEAVRNEKAGRRLAPPVVVLETRAVTLNFERTRDVQALKAAVERVEETLPRLASRGRAARTSLCPGLWVAGKAHGVLANWAATEGDERLAGDHFAAATQRLEQALTHLDRSSPEAILVIDELATVHLTRFDAFRRRPDIDAVIRYSQELVHAHPGLVVLRANLGGALYARYEAFGASDDLDKALMELEIGTEALFQAVTEAPLGSSASAAAEVGALAAQVESCRGMYANGLCSRYERDRTPADLHRALELTSEGSAPVLLAARASALFLLADAADDLEALNGAVAAAEDAAAAEDRSLNLATALMRVAQLHAIRHAQTGDPADLERAQQVGDRLQRLPVSRRADVLRTLSAVAELSGHSGRPNAIETAVGHAEAAFAIDDGGAADRAVSAQRLAESLRMRYVLGTDLEDLDRALGLLEGARRDVPHIERATLLALLADVYVLRFHRTRDADDLDAAAVAARDAVDAASRATAADLLSARTVLVQVIGERLDAGLSTNHREDAEHQIDDLREILSTASLTWPYRPSALRLLAMAHLDRWRDARARGDSDAVAQADLDDAVEILEQALEISAPASIEHVEILRAIATTRREGFATSGDSGHLERAVNAGQQALATLDEHLVELPVSYRIGQQHSFSRLYETAVINYVEWARAHPADAADSLIRAMLACERSKARVLAQQLGTRDIPAPPRMDTDLLTTEKTLVAELATLDTVEYATLGRPHGAAESRVSAVRRRSEVVDALRRTWSALAGTEEGADYVALRGGATLDWGHLQSVARGMGEGTAVLSLFLADDRTYGFVLRAPWDAPALVSSDGLSAAAWKDIGRRLLRELHGPDRSGRLGLTWHLPLKPLLRAAGSHLDGINRVIVAPHAVAHTVPWTVAVDAAGWRPTTAISVVPSLTTLSQVRRRDTHHTGDVLVVGDPRGDLPGAVQEARAVADLHSTPALIGPQATKTAVRARLRHAKIAHLATHAFFAAESPLDSGVVLTDGVLSAREVATAEPVPLLVLLSGCESGVSGRLGGDELAGLAQAFLFSGARSLVVSLWKVDDPATSVFMRTLHTCVHRGDDLAGALLASANHVRASERWCHPHYWGAFVVLGDPLLEMS